MRRLGAALALAGLVLLTLASPAAAHAQLVATTPASGEVLERAPEQLVVRFNEGVQAGDGSVRLHDGNGRRLEVGDLELDDGGKVLSVGIGDLDDGGYVLTWRVVSLDGHPISGGVTWRIGTASGDVDPSLLEDLLNAEGGAATVAGAAALVRGLLFASLLLLVGALVFVLLIWPDGAADRRLVPTMRASVAVAGLATVLGMGLQGAEVQGQPLSHALSVGTALDTLDTVYGQAAALRLGGLLAFALLVWRMTPSAVRRPSWRIGAQTAAVVVLATLGLAGHARTGRWAGIAVPLDVVHLLAAATWVGGLVVLTIAVLPRADELAGRMSARFSTIAAWAVGLVVLTGLFQSIRRLERLDALRETNYGRYLALKVVAVAVIIVLGSVSRSLVRAPAVQVVGVGATGAGGADVSPSTPDPVDPAELQRAVRRSVAAEAAVAAVVVALTSLLVAADPTQSAETRSVDQVKVVATTQLTLVAAPARTGPVDVHLYAEDPNFGLTPDLEATATMSMPDRDIPGIEVPLRYAGRGHWSAYDVDVPIAGRWVVDVTVVVSEFEQREATFTVPID